MKKQFALIKVTNEFYYFDNSSIQYVTEQEFIRKDTEQEVEEWLEAAVEATNDVITKERDYNIALISLSDQNRRKKPNLITHEKVNELEEIYKKALNSYRELFGYTLVSSYDEYRLVKLFV